MILILYLLLILSFFTIVLPNKIDIINNDITNESNSLFTIVLPNKIDVINNDVTNESNRIVTVVTCYYRIDNKSYKDTDYLTWIALFLKIISHVVIFVDETSYQV